MNLSNTHKSTVFYTTDRSQSNENRPLYQVFLFHIPSNKHRHVQRGHTNSKPVLTASVRMPLVPMHRLLVGAPDCPNLPPQARHFPTIPQSLAHQRPTEESAAAPPAQFDQRRNQPVVGSHVVQHGYLQ
jgi:hypothetical protein